VFWENYTFYYIFNKGGFGNYKFYDSARRKQGSRGLLQENL